MRFWDSSAIVPILYPETKSETLLALLREDVEMALAWSTPVECASAICRRHRAQPIPSPLRRQVFARLDAFVQDADSMPANDTLCRRAIRLVATHPLRAADAIQLAAALVWCRDEPLDQGFVCLDNRLRDSALAEGFRVLPD